MTETYQALLKQRAELDKRIEQARTAELDSAISQIRELMTRYGLTAQEIMPDAGRERVRRTRTPVEPKYRDPATGQTWTGRGRAPKWIEGRDRAAYAV